MWTTIGELLINRDGERKPVSSAIRSKQKNKIYDYYGAAGIIDKVDEYLFNERLLLIGEDGANLLSRSKDNAFFADGQYWVNNHAHVLDATDKSILDYVAIMINSMKLDDFITGSAQPKLSQDNLNKIPVMLPPFNEQYRILKEVKHWVSLIDLIECGKDNLIEIIQQVKSKILDLAIHGKLVSQDPNDEPAAELLKRINPKAEIICDSPQYGKLPKGWVWTTLGEISNYGDNKSVNVENINDNEWILELEDLEKDTANINQKLKKKERIIKGVRHSFSKGNILYSKLRTYLNKVLIAPGDGFCTTEMIAFDTYDQISNNYICHVLRSDFFVDYTLQCGYGVKMPRLSTTDARKGLIPLPPLSEQHRIVAKIEELFAQLDKIESSL